MELLPGTLGEVLIPALKSKGWKTFRRYCMERGINYPNAIQILKGRAHLTDTIKIVMERDTGLDLSKFGRSISFQCPTCGHTRFKSLLDTAQDAIAEEGKR